MRPAYLSLLSNSAVVIGHARATLRPWGDTEDSDPDEGVRAGTADGCPGAGGGRPRGGLSQLG